jgi:hypothetical protein
MFAQQSGVIPAKACGMSFGDKRPFLHANRRYSGHIWAEWYWLAALLVLFPIALFLASAMG